MNKGKKEFSDVKLEDVARMVADGFLDLGERIDKAATKDELKYETEILNKKVDKGFAEMNKNLKEHMTDVREQTDNLAYRTKKLEERVF